MTKRKLVAIVLALAMILSTFGTLPAFADGTSADTHGTFKVTIDKDYVLTDTATTVKVTIKEGTKVYDEKVYWALFDADPTDVDNRVTKGTTSTGYVNVPINASVADDQTYYIVVSKAGYPGDAGALYDDVTQYIKVDDDDHDGVVEASDTDGVIEPYEFEDDGVTPVVHERNYDTVTSMHDMEISSPSINYGDTKTLSGKVVTGGDDEIDPAPVVKLYIGNVIDADDDTLLADADPDVAGYQAPTAAASAKASSSGAFAIVATFDDAADWAISLDDSRVIYASGTVNPDENLDVTVDVDTVKVGGVDPEEIIVTVEDEDGDPVVGAVVKISDIEVEALPAADYDIGDEEDAEYAAGALDAEVFALSDDETLYGLTDSQGEVKFIATYAKSGKATVEVFYEDTEDGGETPVLADIVAMVDEDDARDEIDEAAWDNSGKAEYSVANSDALNVSLTPAKDVMDMEDVGTGTDYGITVKFWDSESDGVLAAESDEAENGGIKSVEAVLSGCGFDETAFYSDADPDLDGAAINGTEDAITWADMVPKTGGIVSVKLTATFWDGTKETITKETDVDGWQITLSPSSWTIDTEYNFKAVVTDADGKVINSAYMDIEFRTPTTLKDEISDVQYVDDGKWKDWDTVIDGGDTNINDGTYAETVKFGTAAKYAVCVYNQAGKLQAFKNFEVYGEDTYDVTLDPTSLITLNGEDLVITAKDADGADIETDDVIITIDGTDYDFTRDGEEYTVDGDDIDAEIDAAGEYAVIFRSDDRSEIGKATLKVVDPTIDLGVGSKALTDSVKEALVVKVTDPRDGEALEGAEVRFTTKGAEMAVYENGSDNGTYYDTDADYENEVDEDGLKIDVMAWDNGDLDEDPYVKVEACLNGADWFKVAELPVTEMAITASPDKIPVDAASTVTIEVKDAHGVGLAERVVELKGAVSAESETDKDGKVSFMVKPGASGTIYIEVKNDREDDDDGMGGDATYTEAKFSAVFGSGAVGAGNTKIELMVGRTDAVANGKVATLDVAPFIENGRTMMPFRFIGEALGAKVEWIAAGNKVTFTSADGKIVIELTLGSTEAKVNGAVKTLDVPAKVVNGRTVVPVRFVSENMGCYVDWNFATNAITITK